MIRRARDCIAVIDIGKTNAKVVLVDPEGVEVGSRQQPNTVRHDPPYPHFDVDGLFRFVIAALGDFAESVRAIVPVTHGACAALVDGYGELVLPVLDYEHDGPDATRDTYAPPPFAETGSPALSGGLNVGAQLHWLEHTFPAEFGRAQHLLMWPQWWAMRLSGVAAGEVTSLGCHTDLWAPFQSRPSSLARGRGWDRLIPKVRPARDILGPILPEIADKTALPSDTPILTGVHDSNASLLPYLGTQNCGVLSTGTWVIAMALGGESVTLDPTADMLVNVAVDGRPVPTARFMGGRERDETIRKGVPIEEIDRKLGIRAAKRLSDIGAQGPTYVEGPFAKSDVFLRAISDETGRDVVAADGAGTARGAAMIWAAYHD